MSMKRPGLLLFFILVLLALMGLMIYVAVNTHRFPAGARLVLLWGECFDLNPRIKAQCHQVSLTKFTKPNCPPRVKTERLSVYINPWLNNTCAYFMCIFSEDIVIIKGLSRRFKKKSYHLACTQGV